MTRRALAKIVIDAAILTLMLCLISYPLIRGLWRHAMMGCAFATCFVIHQAFNAWWYRSLATGRWNARRVILTALDFILIADVVVLVTSAVLLAGEVFSFAAFPMTNWARSLHVTATAWALVLASVHLGFHGEAFWKKFKETLGVFWPCAMSCIIGIGAVSFVHTEMIWDLLHEDEMKLLPETFVEFTAQRLGVVMLFATLGRCVVELLQLFGRRKRSQRGLRPRAPQTAPSPLEAE